MPGKCSAHFIVNLSIDSLAADISVTDVVVNVHETVTPTEFTADGTIYFTYVTGIPAAYAFGATGVDNPTFSPETPVAGANVAELRQGQCFFTKTITGLTYISGTLTIFQD